MLGHYAGASFPELARSTGLPASRLRAIVERLATLGIVDAEAAELAEASARVEEPPQGDPSHAEDELVALLDAATFDLVFPLPSEEPEPHVVRSAPPPPVLRRTPPSRRRLDDEDDNLAMVAGVKEDAPSSATPGLPDNAREYRKLFETQYRPLPAGERAALAAAATGADLFAFCFDPVAAVIAAMFENAATTVEHARLIAFHHRDARGLEELAGRPSIAADPEVHRRLLRNPALTEAMLRRLAGGRRLIEVYRLTLDRDVPDRTRSAARTLFRRRFATAPSEERADLLWSTEGRVLAALSGATFDSRMTSILCSKTYSSVPLVQNLARFPATPPALLAHLLRQPIVRRQAHIKQQLLQHPNTPADAKRRA